MHLKKNNRNAESIINLGLIRTPQIIFLPGHEGCDVLYGLTRNETREYLMNCRKCLADGLQNGLAKIGFGLAKGMDKGLTDGLDNGLQRVCSVWHMWSAQRSCPLSGQGSGHCSVRFGHGSLLCGQWSVENLFSPASSGQSLFGLAKWGQSLYGLANIYLRVLSVWPKHVLGMVGLANACLGSRTSSWELKLDKNTTLRKIYQLTTSFNSAYNRLHKTSFNQLRTSLNSA